jgi:hypothetical protein
MMVGVRVLPGEIYEFLSATRFVKARSLHEIPGFPAKRRSKPLIMPAEKNSRCNAIPN